MKKLYAFAVAVVVVVVFVIAVRALRQSGDEPFRPAAEASTSNASGSGAATRATVLVELFTSEGCSSCPPADVLLSRLEKTQPVEGAEVIALAQHVDYWNYLGWRDPFSSAEASARQREYAGAFGKDGVYTPQMIIDGRAEFPGGNTSKAFEAISASARSPKAEVQLKLIPNGDAHSAGTRLSVRVEKLPPVSAGDTVEVLLAITESDLSTSVARGENAGRKLSHVGVTRKLNVLGVVAPGKTFTAEPEVMVDGGWRRENLRAVVFLQERSSKRVLGAAAIKFAG